MSMNLREKLINAIIEYAGDEIETKECAIELAKASEEELLDDLINILKFYHNEYN
jgi:hypothetical protein